MPPSTSPSAPAGLQERTRSFAGRKPWRGEPPPRPLEPCAFEGWVPALPLAPGEELRVAKAVGHTGSFPAPEITAAVRERAADILGYDKDTVYAELTTALCGKHPHAFMQWMVDAGLMQHLLPELVATIDLAQESGRRHKDVWEHTKTVVRQSVPRPAVRWGAMLHDIGKVSTRRFHEGGKVSFLGHAEVGARQFRRGIVKRIAFPPEVRERVEQLILYHLRPGQYDATWTESAIRRFGREMKPWLKDLLDLARADVTSKRPGKRKECLRLVSELGRRIVELEAIDKTPKPLPPGLGNLLMSELALPPGRHLKVLRERLEALHADGLIDGGEEAAYYVAIVRDRGWLDDLVIEAVPQGRRKGGGTPASEG